MKACYISVLILVTLPGSQLLKSDPKILSFATAIKLHDKTNCQKDRGFDINVKFSSVHGQQIFDFMWKLIIHSKQELSQHDRDSDIPEVLGWNSITKSNKAQSKHYKSRFHLKGKFRKHTPAYLNVVDLKKRSEQYRVGLAQQTRSQVNSSHPMFTIHW